MTAQNDASLPILDLRDLAQPDTAAAFERKLRDVTRNIGFFYLVGVPLGDLGERILESAREFFALPEEEKRQIEMVNS
jgi:isopenicillin N synthase-like dioxygenase